MSLSKKMQVMLCKRTIKGFNILKPSKNVYLNIPYFPSKPTYQSDVTGQNYLVLSLKSITLYTRNPGQVPRLPSSKDGTSNRI
jgi:hypothetical protein